MSLILRRNHQPERFNNELDRLWSSWFAPFEPKWSETVMSPPVDVAETETDFIVKAELPGLSEKDIDVTVEDGVLTIKGEKRSAKEAEGKRYHFTERRYGSFQRRLRLSSAVSAQNASARFENGVLEITLPKAEEAKPKKIEVN